MVELYIFYLQSSPAIRECLKARNRVLLNYIYIIKSELHRRYIYTSKQEKKREKKNKKILDIIVAKRRGKKRRRFYYIKKNENLFSNCIKKQNLIFLKTKTLTNDGVEKR